MLALASNAIAAVPATSAPADLTAIASIFGATLTAVVAILTFYFQQRQGVANRREDQFHATLKSLNDEPPRVRAMAVSTLLEFCGSDPRYFDGTLQALCTIVRFDRDTYFIESVFRALARLAKVDSDKVRVAVGRLREDLTRDLLRQIAEYASAHSDEPVESLADAVLCFAPEGGVLIASIVEKHGQDLSDQLQAAKCLTPPNDENYRRWSVRITAMSLRQAERAVDAAGA